MNANKFNPARLTQARKAKKINMTVLADRTGLTRQAISQFERGKTLPSGESLRRLSAELNVATSYFGRAFSEFEKQKESPASFRSMASSTKTARQQAQVTLEQIAMICSDVMSFVEFSEPNVPDFQISDFNSLTNEDIESFAESTRRYFGIGDGPISNLTTLIENHGVIIAKSKVDTALEGLSQWYGGRPLILLDSKSYCPRLRFSLAHELGHLVLHQGLLTEDDVEDKKSLKIIENQANHFASCFLMPESSFSSEFYRADWDSLVVLKRRWIVSIAAMIRRLHAIGLISETRKVSLYKMINMKKAKRIEPLDKEIPVEQPRLLKGVVNLLADHNLLNPCDWPLRFGLSIERLSELTGVEQEVFLPKHDKPSVSNVVYLK